MSPTASLHPLTESVHMKKKIISTISASFSGLQKMIETVLLDAYFLVSAEQVALLHFLFKPLL